MNRHTVGAGLVAAGVIACTGPGMDMVGGAMRDAGETIADAGGALSDAGRGMGGRSSGGRGGRSAGGMGGQVLVDAGEIISDAGQMLADAGGSLANAGRSSGAGGTDAAAQEQSDGLPRPHWVLRDKDGTPVRAEINPGYLQTHPKFSDASPECVAINNYGQRNIGISYRLSSGKPAKYSECPYGLPGATSWRDSVYVYFLDGDCEGQPFGPAGAFTMSVGADLYYTDGTARQVDITTYYDWNTTSQSCVSVQSSGQEFWPFKPVPNDVVNLLPKAPYTMELVY